MESSRMSLESSLREISSGLNSSRVTDRRKNAESLKDYLMRNAVPSLLTENTKKKSGYTWNNLFEDINDYILKECEKYETSKSFEGITSPLCSSLLHLCVAGANKGKAYIKCERIIEACVYILKDNRLKKAIGDSYSNLLYKYVLSCNYYMSHISPNMWENLLDVAISVCLHKDSKLDNFTRYKILWLVLKNSSNNCQLVVPIRDLLPKLKKCILKVITEKKVQEVIVEILIVLVETLSAECRNTLCEFSESIFTLVLNVYDQNLEKKKKSSLFKLLVMIVKLHHPQGSLQIDKGSMAHNWPAWNRNLQNVLDVICLEINLLQKMRKPSEILMHQCDHFFTLAAVVYFQVFNLERDEIDYDDTLNSSKRQKLQYNKNRSLLDLIEELRQNPVPWLGIINSYIKNNHSFISLSDHLTLINVIENLNINTHMDWDIFEETVCAVITGLSKYSQDEYENTILSLWNHCIRNCTLVNASQNALHSIMQCIIRIDCIQFEQVKHLLKMYFEKAMPVSKSSMLTLICITSRFFNKCSTHEKRILLFNWFTSGNINSIDVNVISRFLLQILSNERIDLDEDKLVIKEDLFDTLFNYNERCILFTEFHIFQETIQQPAKSKKTEINVQLNAEIEVEMNKYFSTSLQEFSDRMENDDTFLINNGLKIVEIILEYFNILLKNRYIMTEALKSTELYCSLFRILFRIYEVATDVLNGNKYNLQKLETIRGIQSILNIDYVQLLNTEIRKSVTDNFFHSLHKILNSDCINDEDVIIDEDEVNNNEIKHQCIWLIAAYCRTRGNYRNQLLDLILSNECYNFSSKWDIECAFQTITILKETNVGDAPIEKIFIFLQAMCKDLFRNSLASLNILKTLLSMLEDIWGREDSMRQNCFIMVKGYLQLCDKSYYPPKLAGVIYECVAKIAALNYKQNKDLDYTFKEALLERVKGDIHKIRLHCCYLLQPIIEDLNDSEIKPFITELFNIFLVNMSDSNETVLKDEILNRTLTILHNFSALAQTKPHMINEIVISIIQVQTEKSLDKILVKTVLNIITNEVAKKDIESYLKDNVLMVLHFWFTSKRNLEDFPFYLFGEDDLDNMLVVHMNWFIPADILWSHEGDVGKGKVLRILKNKLGKSEESLIEACFCNIIALCLPFIVIEKYGIESKSNLQQEIRNATRMLHTSRQILDSEKWSYLFVDNMSYLVMMTAKHLRDSKEAQSMFQIAIPDINAAHFYSKNVFLGILKYFGELIEGNIMNFLTEDQPTAMYKTLFEIWDNVIHTEIFAFKVLWLHTYLTFLDNIPMGSASDTFICNFVCRNFVYAIKDARGEQEIEVFTKSLKITLDQFLPEKANELKHSIAEIVSVLALKADEGNHSACAELLEYIDGHWKTCFSDVLNTTEDVIDFAELLSQSSKSTVRQCSTRLEFVETLKTYKIKLVNPSYEILLSLQQFLKKNKEYVRGLCDDLPFNGFSELCKKSILHQVINLLSRIMKSTADDKIKIEACNCFVEIGTFDMKTMMTVPPASTWKVLDVEPKVLLAIEVVRSLQDIMFDDDPTVTSKVVNCLTVLFKYREGEHVFASGDVDSKILKPLASAMTDEITTFKIDAAKFNLYRIKTFWIPRDSETHNQWLVRLATTLLGMLAGNTNYLGALQPVCEMKPSVCQTIVTHLLGMFIVCLPEKYTSMIGDQINEFFTYVWNSSFENVNDSCEDKKSSAVDHELKLIIHTVLDVVNFVRLQKKYYKKRDNRMLATLNYLNLDYIKVAWAATVADQHLTALYYGELWALLQNDGVPPFSPEATSHIVGFENLQRIFRKCYVAIGEMEAVNGCGTAHLTIEEEKRKHLINVGEYSDALLLHDIAMSCGGAGGNMADLQHGVIKSLHMSGMHHLALQYINSIPETDKLNDIKYECLAYLGDWSVLVDTRDLGENSKQMKNTSQETTIKAYRYACLKDCLNLPTSPECEKKLQISLNQAILSVTKFCQNLNMENSQSIYKVVEKLSLFRDIEDYFGVRCEKLSMSELLNQWRIDRLPAYFNFKYLGAMISQRSLLLEHAAKHNVDIAKDIVSLQLQYAEISLSNKNIQMAQRLVATVKKNHTLREVSLMESQISWAKGHHDIAFSLLRDILKSSFPDDKLTAVALRQCGLWMAESKRDNVKDIINKYLKKSLDMLQKSDHVDTRLKVYYDIAKFADSEYNQVVSYMKSSAFESKLKCLESIKGTATQLKSTQQSLLTHDERKAMFTNDRFSKLDEAEIISTKAEKERFLHLAMRYYLLSLRHCEENDLSVFRVTSLWLDNPGLVLDAQDGGSFEDLLQSIPSRKFITVLPQLAPRLTLENTTFANNLRNLIKRCAMEHPHHTLPILFSLKNSDKDEQILNASGSRAGERGARAGEREPREARVGAARALVAALATEPALKNIIAQMERFCDATISLANYDAKPARESRSPIPAAETIHRLGHLDHIPLLSSNIDIRHDCNYSAIITLQSVENYFELVGGINAPKKIFCRTSDGKTKLVLVKGKDDLRQDAVMQQVFNIVNTLLEKNPVTNRNKLIIRTYKVVPMSKRSGILEWCEGTLPLGSYLVGEQGAHARYRPQDMSYKAARDNLTSYHKSTKPNAEKLALFLKILKNFRPVFHYFFTEKYHDPVTWYERRLAYIKSVATSSMVGYILGLGDRHVQNILIDQKTAEVIHIDFGIAFDQGKALPTPESVPFRLTQDMIAGFGCSGVGGIFRRSCENTMQLLRDNQETLLTILEVLLCDPLYSWTVVKAQQNVGNARTSNAQGKMDTSGSLAKRALLGVSSKLSGTEGGVAVGVAVPGQVARLLLEATDPANLSRLFPGWQPYL